MFLSEISPRVGFGAKAGLCSILALAVAACGGEDKPAAPQPAVGVASPSPARPDPLANGYAHPHTDAPSDAYIFAI